MIDDEGGLAREFSFNKVRLRLECLPLALAPCYPVSHDGVRYKG